MPDIREQLGANMDDQEDNLASFVSLALMQASPSKDMLLTMLRYACDHSELAQLNELMRVPDDVVRGGLIISLLGDVLARSAEHGVRRYLRRKAKVGQ